MNGILNVYKEPGFTSHDVVAKLRGICKQKKIGHTGTQLHAGYDGTDSGRKGSKCRRGGRAQCDPFVCRSV